MVALMKTLRGKSWASWRDPMAYIMDTYHESLKASLPRLEGLVEQVAREHIVPIYLLDWLEREFAALADSLSAHLIQQEGHLFPMIRHVCQSLEEAGWTSHLADIVDESMDEAANEGREAVASVKRIENLLEGTNWEGKGPLVGKLVKGLRELRQDLEEHVELEANVLFPVVRELLRGNNQGIEWLLENGSVPYRVERTFDCTAKHVSLPGENQRLWPSEGPTTPWDEIVVENQETG